MGGKMERLQRLVKSIGGFDEVEATPDPIRAVAYIKVLQGQDVGTFEMRLEDLEVEDDYLLGVLIENRLCGLREWAHWERVEQEYLRDHPDTT